MENHFICKPLGIIHSPYKQTKDMPIQGIFKPEGEGVVELKKEYEKGLKDLEKFSHAYLIYYFHASQKENCEGMPFIENTAYGIFAIRGPHRPNHIGLSVVAIKRIVKNKLYFLEADMLDGTPVLDIKPYVKYYDIRENSHAGWLEKHFQNNRIPDTVIVKK
jgi:tRNA (adenine37-N6)-methyltransferase